MSNLLYATGALYGNYHEPNMIKVSVMNKKPPPFYFFKQIIL